MYFGGRRCEAQEKNTGPVPGSSGALPDNVLEGFGLLPADRDSRTANDSSGQVSPSILQFLALPLDSRRGKGTPVAGQGCRAAGPSGQPGYRMERIRPFARAGAFVANTVVCGTKWAPVSPPLTGRLSTPTAHRCYHFQKSRSRNFRRRLHSVIAAAPKGFSGHDGRTIDGFPVPMRNPEPVQRPSFCMRRSLLLPDSTASRFRKAAA
jgi:hypothetical protein